MTTIADLVRMGPGQNVRGLEATVAVAWPAEEKQGQNGTFISQGVVLRDADGREMRARITDPPAGSLNKGERIRVSAYQDQRKQWRGAITDEWQNTVQLKLSGKAIEVLTAMPATTSPGTAPAPSRANGAYPGPLSMPGDPPEQRRPQASAASPAQAMTEHEAREFFLRNMEHLLAHFGYLQSPRTREDLTERDMLQVALEAPPPHVLELLGAWVTSMFIATRPSRDGVHVQIEGRES